MIALSSPSCLRSISLVGDDGSEGFVYSFEMLPKTSSIRGHFVKSPPAALAAAAAAAIPHPFSFGKRSLGILSTVAVAVFFVQARATSSVSSPLVNAIGGATTFGIMFMCVALMLRGVHRVVATVFCYVGLLCTLLDIFLLVAFFAGSITSISY